MPKMMKMEGVSELIPKIRGKQQSEERPAGGGGGDSAPLHDWQGLLAGWLL
jgi:hypothetical protein